MRQKAPHNERRQLLQQGLRRCSICLEVKSVSHFNPSLKRWDKLQTHCTSCSAKASYKYLLGWKYGLTPKILAQKIQEQNNQCAICKKQFGLVKDSKPHVDHDHKTNKFRGIVCGRCNKALGNIQDSLDTAKNLILYLEKNLCNSTPLNQTEDTISKSITT